MASIATTQVEDVNVPRNGEPAAYRHGNAVLTQLTERKA